MAQYVLVELVTLNLGQGHGMKVFFLILIFVTGCSSQRYYKTTDITQKLKIDSQQLVVISYGVNQDYSEKLAFYEQFQKSKKITTT